MENLEFEILKEQENLELTSFTNEDVFKLGKYLSEKSIKENLPIVIMIKRNDDMVFFYANKGTSNDNIWWVERKLNIVKRFQKSSAYIDAKLKSRSTSFADFYGDDKDFAATGGAFPIRVKNVGVVGAIGISGLDSNTDHNLAVDGIKFLIDNK